MAPPNHSHPEYDRTLGRLEEKVETLTDGVKTGFKKIDERLSKGEERFQKQNGRIGKLSGKNQLITGGIAVVVFLAPWILLLISYLT